MYTIDAKPPTLEISDNIRAAPQRIVTVEFALPAYRGLDFRKLLSPALQLILVEVCLLPLELKIDTKGQQG